jgi:glycosyltransferase involved in cell wall biosynthesis
MKIAYLMSRFPKITETFVLHEIMAIKQAGIAIDIYPLQRQKSSVIHPQARLLLNKVHFYPFISLAIIYSNLQFLWQHPVKYIGTFVEVLKATWGSANFLLGTLVFFPKAVKIAHQCQKSNVSHIHAHFANHPTMVAFVIYRLTGIGYSFTSHGSDLHKRQQMLAKKFNHCRFAVMISRYNKQFFEDKTGLDAGNKMPVIRCGVDMSAFAADDRKRLKPGDDKSDKQPINLLCIASLIEVKGHPFLLEACSILKGCGIAFRLNLVGDGDKRKTIEALIKRYQLEDNVVVHGALPQPQVIDLLNSADICVLTSYQTKSGSREGIPVVLMEAMACGKAVVASRISGIPELVEDNKTGLLANPTDPASIAKQLEVLIKDKALRTRMGQAGRAKVQSEFNLTTNIEQLIQWFKRY